MRYTGFEMPTRYSSGDAEQEVIHKLGIQGIDLRQRQNLEVISICVAFNTMKRNHITKGVNEDRKEKSEVLALRCSEVVASKIEEK